MRIPIKDLPSHLKRDFKNFYFVFGEEPLQHSESIDLIRQEARKQGYTREIFDINARFNWDQIFVDLDKLNLFSPKRLIECRLNDVKMIKETTEGLIKLSSYAVDQNTVILLSAQKIDSKLQQSPWFSAIEQKAYTLFARPLSLTETARWLEARLMAAGFQPTPAVIQLLLEKTEGNLLASAQAIEKFKLCECAPSLTTQDVLNIVGMDARFTVFGLVDSALSGAVKRTSQIFTSLRREGVDPILVVWAIAREVRIIINLSAELKKGVREQNIFAKLGVWKQREPLIKAFIERAQNINLQHILVKLKDVDDILKGRRPGKCWDQLFSICLVLSGALHE